MSTDLQPVVAGWMAPRSEDGAGLSLMDRLWQKFDALYPGRWAGSFQTPQSLAAWKNEWALGFARAGLSPRDLSIGLDACRLEKSWPPSCGEFISLCRQSIDLESAYREAANKMPLRWQGRPVTFSSPVVFWAAQELGAEVVSMPYGSVRVRWAAIVAGVQKRMSLGELPAEVPAYVPALQAPGKVPLTQREGREKLASLRQAMPWLKSRSENPALEAC